MTHLVTWIHGLGLTHGFMVFARNDTLGDPWIPGLRQE